MTQFRRQQFQVVREQRKKGIALRMALCAGIKAPKGESGAG